MRIILKGNNEQYAVRDIVRLFTPAESFLFEEEIAANENYIEVIHTQKESNHLYTVNILLDNNYYTHCIQRDSYHKNHVKRALYELLEKIYKISPPWGILTGIRPSKAVIELWKDGNNREKTKEILKNEYLVSDKKIHIASETATVEKNIISDMQKDSVSLYVGIPFCPSRCSYCSFISQSIKFSANLVEPYLEALRREFIATAKLIDTLGLKAETIYIGGGTPTTLSAQQLYTLLGDLYTTYDLSGIKEFTLEAGRPDTIDKEKLEIIKQAGVGRISINPQTMNDKTLEIIGRRHSADDIKEKFFMARDVGFNHINTDLIAGLPGEDENDFMYTLSEIEKLNPDSVTVHSLSLKRGAYLDKAYDCLSLKAADTANKMIDMACDKMKSMGKHPYYMYRQKNTAGNLENIGFCDKGKESLYNIYIMQEIQTIIALGSGASTKKVCGDNIERCFNVKEVSEYINRIDEMIQRKYNLFEVQ